MAMARKIDSNNIIMIRKFGYQIIKGTAIVLPSVKCCILKQINKMLKNVKIKRRERERERERYKQTNYKDRVGSVDIMVGWMPYLAGNIAISNFHIKIFCNQRHFDLKYFESFCPKECQKFVIEI